MSFHYIIILSLLSVCMAEEDITAGPPPHDKPWVPAWGFNKSDSQSWKNNHMKLVQQTEEHKDDVKIIFFGDSKTWGWSDQGKPVWDKHFANRGAYNYGIRGDSTRQELWRIEHKELDGLSPQLIVFMIGGNNLKKNYNRGTDEEISKGFESVIQKLMENFEDSKMIVILQIPRLTSDDRARNINHLMEDYFLENSYDRVLVLNPHQNYTKSNGKENKEYYISDGFHLNEKGYELMAELLEPLVEQALDQ